MALERNARTAVCTAALILGLGAFAAHAQDTPAEPAETPPAAAQPAAPAESAAPATPADPAASEPVRNPADVVARVGENTITEAEVTIGRQEFGSELESVPENEQRGLVIDALVNMELIAQAARDAGLDQGPEFEQRLEFMKTQALRNLFVQQNIVGSISPEDLQAGYERLIVSAHTPQEE